MEYRIQEPSLQHAYVSKYKSRDSYKPITTQARKREIATSARREARTRNPYGAYKSPYYDPVKRHEYYEAHKTHKTRPYGVGASEKLSSSRGSSGKGGSGKGSKGGSGKGSKGSASKASKAQEKQNISDAIAKLREESALDTEAHREATRRRIEDLRSQIYEHSEKLKERTAEGDETVNTAEIRGRIQELRDEIEKAGLDLNEWIENEREALIRRIEALTGKKYSVDKEAKQRAQEANKQKVSQRADAIYKKKS